MFLNLLNKIYPAGPTVKLLKHAPHERKFQLREYSDVIACPKAEFWITARLLAYRRRSHLPEEMDQILQPHESYRAEQMWNDQFNQTDYPEIPHDMLLAWGLDGNPIASRISSVDVENNHGPYGARLAYIYGCGGSRYATKRSFAYAHAVPRQGLTLPDFWESKGKVLYMYGWLVDLEAPDRAPWFSDTQFGDCFGDSLSRCETMYLHGVEVL